MDNDTETNILEKPLKSSLHKKINSELINKSVDFLNKRLPSSDVPNLNDEAKWTFTLDKRKEVKKLKKNRKKLLSRREKNKLGLSKLPKDGWSYSQLTQMNVMWNEYVTSALNHPERLPKPEDYEYANFCSTLNKLELIGARIKVIRANVPSYVGKTGIVVQETKYTLQFVNEESQLKVLSKQSCEFELYINNWRFTMFGKHFLVGPGDRSNKKNKYFTIPDL